MRVLVADDSGVMRKISVRILGECGITDVMEAKNGEEALDKFGAMAFDLVLTDWNMPKMTGLELVRNIRATGSDVPIIMITTEAEKDRVVEAIQAGVNDYLTRPFERPVLQAKIERFIQVS